MKKHKLSTLILVAILTAGSWAWAQSIRYIDESGNIIFVESIDQIPAKYRNQLITPTPTPDMNNKNTSKAYREYLKEKKRLETEKKKEDLKKKRDEEREKKRQEKEQKKREKEEAKKKSKSERDDTKRKKEYGSKSVLVEPVSPGDKNDKDSEK